MSFDLDKLRSKLLSERRSLREEDQLAAVHSAPVLLDQESVGRLSRMDAIQMQAMAVAQRRRREAHRTAIDAALSRMDEGEFGYCLKCGERIAPARLEHNPSAPTCIGCARGGEDG